MASSDAPSSGSTPAPPTMACSLSPPSKSENAPIPESPHSIAKTQATKASDLPAREARFVPNKVERAWIINQLCALGAPVQKAKTLEATCATVARNARSLQVSDEHIVKEQNSCGMSWRRAYMAKTSPSNVMYIASIALKQARQVILTECGEEREGHPTAAMREGGKEGDAQHLLDQALLDYKAEASKRVSPSEDASARMQARRKESRKERTDRLAKRKRDYGKVKKEKGAEKKRRAEECRAAERHHLAAETMTANAASASVAIAARQWEQFGAFPALYALKNNLNVPQPSNPMPGVTSSEPLVLDSQLLQPNATGPIPHRETTSQEGDDVRTSESN